MRDCIARLERLAVEAKQQGMLFLAHKLNDIIADMCAIEDGRDMGTNLGGSNNLE